jgi:hypothetical protein
MAMDCEGRGAFDLEEAGKKNFTRMTIGARLTYSQTYTSNMKEIKDCELHECELAFERCILEKFPVEIRRMIFELCLQRKRKERGCALIAALRGHGEIYQEALEVFRKLNSFPFQYGDSEEFKILPSRVVSTIRKIIIV